MLTDTTVYPGIRAALLTARALTQIEATPLRTLIASDPRFKDENGNWLPVDQLLSLLNDRYWVKNTVTVAPRVPKERLMQGELIVLASQVQGRRLYCIAHGTELDAKAVYAADVLIPSVAKQQSMDLTDPQVQQVIGLLSTTPLLPPDDLNLLTTLPDPTWTEYVEQDSLAQQATGHPCVIELYDLAALLA